jgi:hypothetical protein
MASLRLKRPAVRTLLLAAVFVITASGLTEFVLRLGPVRDVLPAPSLGSGHQNFDLKLARLDAFIKKEGGVDCIFLGPSTVNYGLDPEVVRDAYKSRTGKDLRCFNFGLAALNNVVMADLVNILIDRCHPRFILIGTFPGQERFGRNTADLLLANPWFTSRLGQKSFRGWLLEHSLAYRYFLRFRLWLEHPNFSKLVNNLEARTRPDGFTWSPKAMPEIENPPDPKAEREYFRRFAHFRMSRSQLAALDRVLQAKARVGLAVLEMPIHPTALSFFGNGAKDYAQVVSSTRARAERAGIPFWSTAGLALPAHCWRDRHHLNTAGARILSLWLEPKLEASLGVGPAARPGGRP